MSDDDKYKAYACLMRTLLYTIMAGPPEDVEDLVDLARQWTNDWIFHDSNAVMNAYADTHQRLQECRRELDTVKRSSENQKKELELMKSMREEEYHIPDPPLEAASSPKWPSLGRRTTT